MVNLRGERKGSDYEKYDSLNFLKKLVVFYICILGRLYVRTFLFPFKMEPNGYPNLFQINALMHALIDLRKKNPNIKSLVVSQFTTFLSLIETPLR